MHRYLQVSRMDTLLFCKERPLISYVNQVSKVLINNAFQASDSIRFPFEHPHLRYATPPNSQS